MGFEPVDPEAHKKRVAEIISEYDDLETGTHWYLVLPPDKYPPIPEWVKEVPVYRGYLNWTPQPDGSVVFTCDRCGQIIILRR